MSPTRNGSPVRFGIYVSSVGNYFFSEFQELYAAAFSELGVSVRKGSEKTGFFPNVDWHLVIAPHEFFHIGGGIRLRHQKVPRGLILFVTDAVDSKWFALAKKSFDRATEIWCLDADTAEAIAAEGYPCRYIPVGYSAKSRLFRQVRRLPSHYGTAHLDKKTIGPVSPQGRLKQRPIDIIFQGALTGRRDKFFSETAELLGRYRTFLNFSNPNKRALSGDTTTMNTETALGLAQRSKIVLNIHRRQFRWFEWHRVAVHGIGQRALVISEPGSHCGPLVPGRDFVEAPLGELPERIEYFLGKGAGEAQRIADRGWKTFTEECRLSDRLRAVIGELSPQLPRRIKQSLPLPEFVGPAEVDVLASGGKSGKSPIVTVGITLHNYEQFIEGCLDSVKAQTLKRFDLIIVDDRSNDKSEKIVRAWLKKNGRRFARWEFVRAREWSGLPRARNACFDRARTPSVFVLDADNVIYPRCLEMLSQGLECSKADFAYGYQRAFGECEEVKNAVAWDEQFLLRGNSFDAMALVRKSAWRKLKGYRRFAVQGLEDFDFWLRLAKQGGFGQMVPGFCGGYRVHLRSMLHTQTYPKILRLESYFESEFGVDFKAGGVSNVEIAFSLFGSNKLPPVVKKRAVKGRAAEKERYLHKAMTILDDLNRDLKDGR